MPGTIGTSFLFSTPFTKSDWLEAVALHSPSQLTMGRKKSYATLTAYVENFDKLKNCVLWLMGSQNATSTNELYREKPARHPIYEEMYAKEILSLTGITFDEKEEALVPGRLDFAKYSRFKVECAFCQRDYVLDTSPDLPEYKKWTLIKSKPFVENIVMEFGSMIFEATGKSWDAKPMTARPIVRRELNIITLEWYEVPLDFVANASSIYPKFDEAIGKLNETEFLGKPRGTLLLDDVDPFDVYTDPITTDLFGGDPIRCADIRFTFKHFDPPRGLATETRRGHQLMPAQDQLYYWVKNQSTSEPLLRYYEFANLFTHWNA